MEEKFIEYMKEERLSENTYNSYASDVQIFKSYYIDSYGEDLKELIHSDIKMYINYLYKNNIAPTTINRKIVALKRYNLFLINEGLQKNVVINDKDYIKVQKGMIPKVLPDKQSMNKLYHSASIDPKHAKRDYCVIVLFANGGLRESELVSIRLVDIKLEERLIYILGKGNKFRKVIINDIMYDALEEYLKERKEIKTDNPYLFIGQKNKNTQEPLNRNFCNRILEKYTEECKIAKINPHKLRSLFCTNALTIGYTIVQVADQART